MVHRHSRTPVFILAGGAGERLNPLTEARPKPAVSFGGTHQIIDFTFSNCINSGLRKIFVLTQYHGEFLRDYVRQSRLRLSSSFRWQDGDALRSVSPVTGKRYRGTADAVFQNLSLIRFDSAEHVLITSGDQVYSMDYFPLIAAHAASGATLTIAAARRPVAEATACGVLDVENRSVVRFREKPAPAALPESGDVLVNMGVYVFKREALLDIADRADFTEIDFGRHIIPRLVHREEVQAYDFGSLPRNYWRDVGSLDSYFQANMDLLGSRPAFDLDSASTWPVFALNDPAMRSPSSSRISRHSVIARSTIQRSVVSHGSWVETGATIENSVILPGAHVGRSAFLRNTILAEGASIPDGFQVGVNLSLDRDRFLVTSGGVVVVNTHLPRPHPRSDKNHGDLAALANQVQRL